MERRSEIKSSADKAAHWGDELRLARKDSEQWWNSAEKIQERYRDEKKRTKNKANILQSNIALLQPSVYSSTPTPDVRRRQLDLDPARNQAGRDAAEMLERALTYIVDSFDFDGEMEAVRDDMLLVGRGVGRVMYDVDIIRRMVLTICVHIFGSHRS